MADGLGAQGACEWRAQAGAEERILAPDGRAAGRSSPGLLGLELAGPRGESGEARAASTCRVLWSRRDPDSQHVGSGGEGEGEGAAARASPGGRGAGLREV